jgi:hypothetical protein
MRMWKIIVPPALVLVGLLVCSTVGVAKPEYGKKENQKCVYCHTKMGSKDLNSTGTCYKAAGHSLAKCAPPDAGTKK